MGAWLIYILAMLGQEQAWRYSGWDINSIVPKIFIGFITHALMSAAFVYFGSFIVPVGKKKISYILAALTLIPGLFGVVNGITYKDYWFVLNSISIMCGSCFIAFLIYKQKSEHVDFKALLKW